MTEGNKSTDQMAPATLEALKGSIAKWERVVTKGANGMYWKDCPLCALFWEKDCRGCPVMLRTGQDSCNGSPFEDYALARDELSEDEWDQKDIGADSRVVSAAQAELDFLKSLLPKEPGHV